jgi:hypothetical protein
VIIAQVIRTETEDKVWLLELLEGKNVNLRVMEKEDVALSSKWINEGSCGEYGPNLQLSKTQEEKCFENLPPIEHHSANRFHN